LKWSARWVVLRGRQAAKGSLYLAGGGDRNSRVESGERGEREGIAWKGKGWKRGRTLEPGDEL